MHRWSMTSPSISSVAILTVLDFRCAANVDDFFIFSENRVTDSDLPLMCYKVSDKAKMSARYKAVTLSNWNSPRVDGLLVPSSIPLEFNSSFGFLILQG